MRRREFMASAGAAILSWPIGAHAQSGIPVIGFLRNTAAEPSKALVAAFHKGLAEQGFVEGKNLMVEYRWADHADDRLPALAEDLVRHGVAVIVAGGGAVTALAAKSATGTIPVVFEMGGDPVKVGLVASLNRPGGNVTGIALFANDVGGKRFELLRRLIPSAGSAALLVYAFNPNIENETRQVSTAAQSLGMRLQVERVADPNGLEAAFRNMKQGGTDAMIVAASPFFISRSAEIVALAQRYSVPAIYPFRSFARAGGLISYGDSLGDAFEQMGVYAGRILKGANPADLPVVQATLLELVVNLKTAHTLGLDVPPTLLATADELIE
jgi:putative ABC transport system substrate-binding protein